MDIKTKDLRRRELKGLLKALDRSWVESASKAISSNLIELLAKKLPQVNVILGWMSFFAGEPNLSQFLLIERSRRAIYLPRSLPDDTLEFVLAEKDWETHLSPGIHGIPEPLNNSKNIFKTLSPSTTLILVPGLAFDSKGERLGRGKGYYDRFLSKPENQGIIKVGVGWDMQILNEVPVDKHDVAMDYICTENSILEI